MQRLHEVLRSDQPVALRRIEKALASVADRNETAETALSALIWRRHTSGHDGVLGTFLHQACARRIGVLPRHLEKVGAKGAASAIRELRNEIPFEDRRLQYGILDWVESTRGFASRARELDKELDDIGPRIWSFMREHAEELPNVTIPDRRRGLLERFFS